MVAQREPRRMSMSVEEWRELERTSHESKHEYIDGQVYALAGGTLAHSRIASNLLRSLEDALSAAGKPCSVYNSDVAVRISATRYTYPDITVTCDEGDRAAPDKSEVQAPLIIVEVLSDSTEAYDRGRKFSIYRACPSLQEYVVVASRYQAIEVYSRTTQGWTSYHAYGSHDQIELSSLAIRFPSSTVYRNAGVPESPNSAEEEREI